MTPDPTVTILDDINRAAGYKLTLEDGLENGACIKCGSNFSDENVETDIGIASMSFNCMCEPCWRGLFATATGGDPSGMLPS